MVEDIVTAYTGRERDPGRETCLLVLIGCDTDPLQGQDNLCDGIKEQIWDSTISHIQAFRESVLDFTESTNAAPGITWFLRSDYEIFRTCGDWCFPARRYHSMWKEFEDSGDEIGWHPHLTRWDPATLSWYQESADETWIRCCLDRGHSELSRLFDIQSVKMGWHFHNNCTIQVISSLGISYDPTPVPGYASSQGRQNLFDWKNAGHDPYFPSVTDYSVQDPNPSRNLPLLEIPITVSPLPLLLRALTKQNLMVSNITLHPQLFRVAVRDVLSRSGGTPVLVTFFHPEDLRTSFGLHSLNNFRKNLNLIAGMADKAGREVEFLTTREFGSWWIRTRENTGPGP